MADLTQHERRKRRATFISLQNHVSSLELRVKKFCEGINFEIRVEPVSPSVCERQRYLIKLNPDANDEEQFGDDVRENLDHPLKKRIYKIKKIQSQYKSLKDTALEKFTELEEEYKHENVNIILLEYKAKSKCSDEDSSSGSESDLSEYDNSIKYKSKESNPQTGSETETAGETESLSTKEYDSESSSNENSNDNPCRSMNQVHQKVQELHKPSVSFYDTSMLNEVEEKAIEGEKDEWETASKHTKDLVRSLLGEELLATNKLSNKSQSEEEPVFDNSHLDELKIKDIIEIICSKFNISELSARNMIATKFADAENKLRRKSSEK